ncbi:hypothetical protein [Halocynthiibacter namhaensis]|uniref:hypothetical protein n=1 Tax=Halocynthiibacter namhaensis TaxID=1290553 RepID=UPI0005793552|nr:hypothetical protein [Halocynthiibacter namhaensis]
MTKAEQSIADDKMRAEIAKLMAETSHIQVETNYYVLFRGIALGAGLLGAGAAATKLLFGL